VKIKRVWKECKKGWVRGKGERGVRGGSAGAGEGGRRGERWRMGSSVSCSI